MGALSSVGMVLHPERDSAEAVATVVGWARGRGVEVLGLHEEVGRIDGAAVPVDAAQLAERATLLVSVGGDGTLLRALRLLEGRPTPVLGVNLGKLGFLAEVDVPELREELCLIDDHRYLVEPRSAAQTTLPTGAT